MTTGGGWVTTGGWVVTTGGVGSELAGSVLGRFDGNFLISTVGVRGYAVVATEGAVKP